MADYAEIASLLDEIETQGAGDRISPAEVKCYFYDSGLLYAGRCGHCLRASKGDQGFGGGRAGDTLLQWRPRYWPKPGDPHQLYSSGCHWFPCHGGSPVLFQVTTNYNPSYDLVQADSFY